MKALRQPKLSWDQKTGAEKVLKANYVVANMIANVAVYANPIPSLVDISTAATALEIALVEILDGSHLLVAKKNTAELKLNHLMSGLLAYVKAASGGDEGKILLSGMDVKKKPSPTPSPLQVRGMYSDPALKQGQIFLKWKRTDYTRSYIVEQYVESEDGKTGTWHRMASPSKSKLTVENLITGNIYKFRVAAVGTGDRVGPFSQVVSSVAR